jgi:hypothetical protein
MTRLPSFVLVAILIAHGALVMSPSRAGGQTLETETARLVPAGGFEVTNNFEFQRSSEGTETTIPLAFAWGITDRLELLVEPVVYTAIRPKVGPRATGLGDLEMTLSVGLRRETPGGPALAFAGEVKAPTARNVLIGTGKADVAGYLIASKRFGRVDLHANLGYTIVGRPAGLALDNIVNGAVAAVFYLTPHTHFFSEVLASTSAAPNGVPESPTAPEVAAGEIVGTIGVAHQVLGRLLLAASVSDDNRGAVLFRPGFVLRFR